MKISTVEFLKSILRPAITMKYSTGPTHSNKIKITNISFGQNEDIKKKAVDLLALNFSKNEPMSRILNITSTDAQITFEMFMKEKLIMLIAQDCRAIYEAQTKLNLPLVGVMFGLDLYDYQKMQFQIPTVYKPIVSILSSLDKAIHDNFPNINKGELLHASALAVDTPGKGIGKALRYKFLDTAKELGYKYVISEATNVVTQNLQKKMGAKVLKEIKYSDFLYEGSKVFEGIKDTEGVQLTLSDLSTWPPISLVGNSETVEYE